MTSNTSPTAARRGTADARGPGFLVRRLQQVSVSIFLECLKPLNITQVEAAERMGVPFQRMNTLVKGRRGVTADTALRLAALTGMDAGFWMGLQADYDLWHALRNVDLSGITRLEKSA